MAPFSGRRGQRSGPGGGSLSHRNSLQSRRPGESAAGAAAMRGWYGSRTLVSALLGGQSQPSGAAANRRLRVAALRRASGGQKGREQQQLFDTALLQFLVCPLSKKPLRYEESTNELINQELGIAYPITDGIPNMIPQAARMIDRKIQDEESKKT